MDRATGRVGHRTARRTHTARAATVSTVVATVVALALAACSDDRSADATNDGSPTTAGTGTGIADGAATTLPPAPDTTEPSTTEAPLPRWATGDSSELFDADELQTFEIDLPDEALAELDASPAAEEYVEGVLRYDGETVEPIGVRYKGSIGGFLGCTDSPNPFDPVGPKTCTKLSMKLKIDWDDPDRTFFGVRKLQFHAMNLDSSLMHDRLGYWTFREMGVPAPRANHVRLVVNGEFVGVFLLVEEVDGRFTREAFDDGSGNLYKEVWPIDASGAVPDEDEWLEALETNRDEDPDVDIITSFATELLAAPVDERPAVLERWTDVDTLLRTIVVDRAIGNDDGPLHWYCMPECAPHNFFWYEDPTARTVTLIPWDLDNAFDALLGGNTVGAFVDVKDPFGEITDECRPFSHGSFGLQQRSAACDPVFATLATYTDRYDELRAELLAGPFSPERIEEQLTTWSAQIEDAVAEAAEAHDDAPSVDSWRAALDTLRLAVQVSRDGDGR